MIVGKATLAVKMNPMPDKKPNIKNNVIPVAKIKLIKMISKDMLLMMFSA